MANNQQNSNSQISASNFLLMQERIETSKGENKILRQKLQSKSEALIILSQELDKVRNECEDYRELTRRLQTQWSLLSSDLDFLIKSGIFGILEANLSILLVS